ncbi:hypothetical protein BZARG_1597 [Bizionia argentinensis JUB59]|uniref:Uncharacterized protein n=1 Tax=Bizionia argentinensis JUB59 TaxID=1046627 RepID=G2EA91_9FLAO|nr:hypothetical protein [Bizionia argentinensis]EGV44630.2 hypothetical protein BZARG_1597 [Bizionia argentinensis JUB59]
MKHLLVLSSFLLTLTTTVASNFISEKKSSISLVVTSKSETEKTVPKIQEIQVFNVKEQIDLGFDVNQYLPENFNPLAGKNDLNWNNILIIETPVVVNLDFDIKFYLPKNFNPLKGKNDIDWDNIELIEIEEELHFNFNVNAYLPKDFNPNK